MSKAKRIFAILSILCLACCIFSCALFTSAETATPEECESTPPTTALGLSTNWWPTQVTVTDLADNAGIHYGFTDCSYGHRAGPTTLFALDGLHFRVANYSATAGDNSFNFFVSSAASASDAQFGADAGKLSFVIGSDGKVVLYTAKHAGGDTLCDANEDLAYAALSTKSWDVKFAMQEDGSLQLTIAGKTLTISASVLTDSEIGTNVYVAFEARGATTYSFDLVALHGGECTKADAEPPEPVKPQDPANPIEKELEIPVIDGDIYAKWGTSWDIADRTEDGIEISGTTTHGTRVGYANAVNLDGLRIVLNKVDIQNQVLTFTLGNEDCIWWDSNCLMFMLYNQDHTEAGAPSPNGWLRIREFGENQHDELIQPFANPVFGTEDALTSITIRFYKGVEGQWYLCVNDEVFPFDIERTHLDNLDEVYVTFGTWDGNAVEFSYFVDTITCTNDEAKVFDVMDKIDAIGTVTLDSEDAINEAKEAYSSLYKGLKPLVSNYAKLTAAAIDLEELKAAQQPADPTPEKPTPSDPTPEKPAEPTPEQPVTGNALPVAGIAVTLLALGAAAFTLRKKA